MKVAKCGRCAAEIPTGQGFELKDLNGEPVEEDFCTSTCLIKWVDERHPVVRPDFAGAHAKVSSLPVSPTTGQRITSVELAADEVDRARAEDALDDLVDTGALDGSDVDDALEPFDPIALIGRKTRPAGQLSSLPGPDVARMIRDNRETGS